MPSVTEHELVRALAREFDRRGWDDEDDVALAITADAVRRGRLDVAEAVKGVPPAFLEQKGVGPRKLREAIAAAFADRQLVLGPNERTVVNHFEISGDGVIISGNVNVGGTTNVTVNSPADEVLTAVGALVRDALASGFSQTNLEALESIVGRRDDLDQQAIQRAAREAIADAKVEPSALAKLRDAIITSTLSGTAVQGILAAIAAAPL